MAVKKTVSEPEARLVNPDGSLAPRPGAGAMYETGEGLTHWGAPHDSDPGQRNTIEGKRGFIKPVAGNREIPVGDVLPFAGVAGAAVGKHVGVLKGSLGHIDHEIECTNVFGVNGSPNTYQLDRLAHLRASAAQIRGEIEDIATWSDHQCQLWAREHGYR
jgi:hypothetical protein